MNPRRLGTNARRLQFAITVSGLFFATTAWGARTEIKKLSAPRPLYQIPRKNLYAQGRAVDGRLITVINGNIATVSVDNGKAQPDTSFKTVAASLTYANVANWSEIPVPGEVKSQADLHQLIVKTLREFGYENPGTVPFLLKGNVRVGSDKSKDSLILGFFTKSSSTPSELSSTMQTQSSVVNELVIPTPHRISLYLPR